MGKSRLLSLLIYLLLKLISLPPLVVSICCSGPCQAISYCNGPCGPLNPYNEYKYTCNGMLSLINYECKVGLKCINGKCNDDPDLGTHTCQETTPSLQSGGCEQSGNLTCEGCKQSNEEPTAPLCENGELYPTYECSPTVTSSTPAKLTHNDFSEGGDGGYEPSCGGVYLPNKYPIVALSTGWYNVNDGTRCDKTIHIQASNGWSVDAKVVDECNSMIGCDDEHAGQRPCENNIVDGSKAVWDALKLDPDPEKDGGEVNITWSIVD